MCQTRQCPFLVGRVHSQAGSRRYKSSNIYCPKCGHCGHRPSRYQEDRCFHLPADSPNQTLYGQAVFQPVSSGADRSYLIEFDNGIICAFTSQYFYYSNGAQTEAPKLYRLLNSDDFDTIRRLVEELTQ